MSNENNEVLFAHLRRLTKEQSAEEADRLMEQILSQAGIPPHQMERRDVNLNRTSGVTGEDIRKVASSRIDPMKPEDYVSLVAALVAETSAIDGNADFTVTISEENLSRWQGKIKNHEAKVIMSTDPTTRTVTISVVTNHTRQGQQPSCSGPYVTCPYVDPCKRGCLDNPNNQPPPPKLNHADVRRRGKSEAAKEVFGG